MDRVRLAVVALLASGTWVPVPELALTAPARGPGPTAATPSDVSLPYPGAFDAATTVEEGRPDS